MFNTIKRSFQLLGICWGVLRADKELMLFPLISFIVLIPVELSYFGVQLVLGSPEGIAGWVLIFIYYLISYFVIIFFNSALIFGARIRLQGGDPTLSTSLSGAMQRIPQIFLWAMVSATVSVILRVIEKRFGIIGAIISGLVGIAWGLGTYFVVPVLVAEGLGPVAAIKRSGSLFKNTWGETVAGNFGLGLAFFVAIILWGIVAVVLLVGATSVAGFTGGAVVGVLLGISLAVIILGFTAMDGIYKAALYEYASTGTVPGLFPRDVVTESWTAR